MDDSAARISISRSLEVHVLTADTLGSVRKELAGIPCTLFIIPRENQAQAKANHVESMGFDKTVCIGNWRNDRLMLKEAALGIAVILQEGGSPEAVLSADVVTHSITPGACSRLLRYPVVKG